MQTQETKREKQNSIYWPKWYAENKEHRRQYHREYYQQHRAEIDAKKERRRILAQQTGPRISTEQFQELCEKYGNKCLACGAEGQLERDHVVPLIHGGPNTLDNIQPLCHACNVRKGSQTIDYR